MAYFIRVDAETEVTYELIAKPVQEPPAEEQPTEEAIDQVPGEITTPANLKASPGAYPLF